MSDIRSAIDSVMSSAAPDTPATPDTPSGPPVTSGNSPAPGSAPRSGSERRSQLTAQPEGATIQPASEPAASTASADPDQTGSLPQDGTPPQERWPSILENTRKAEAEKTRKAVIAEYGLPPEKFAPYKSHIKGLIENPRAYAKWLAERTGILPSEQSSATSEAPKPRASRPKPSLAVINPDGSHTPAYSAADLDQALEYQQAEMASALDRRLAPLEGLMGRVRQQESEAKTMAKGVSYLENARKNWAAFDDVEPKIIEIMREDEDITLFDAYHRALKEFHLPSLSASVRQQTLNELKQAPKADPRPPRTARDEAPRRPFSINDHIDRIVGSGMSRA